MSSELTAIILTLNESDNIIPCLESLAWADRTLVFDSYSDDGTPELAEEVGVEVKQAVFVDYASQRNAALASLKTDWVLFVDADERGSVELGSEIREVIGNRPESGWYIPRHNYIFGRLTLGGGWYPDYQFRLFRHGHVRYIKPVHEIAEVDGIIGYLQNPLTHHNYEHVAQFKAKQHAYTEYDATILKEQGIRPKAYTPCSQPVRHWWWRFVSLKGYRDGLHGLRLSIYMAYYERQKYLRLRRLLKQDQR